MSFDKAIDRRGTYCTQWDFVEDRFGEADLLPFTISDTDFCCARGSSGNITGAFETSSIWLHEVEPSAIKKKQFKRGTRQDSRRRLKNTGLCIPRPLSMGFLL